MSLAFDLTPAQGGSPTAQNAVVCQGQPTPFGAGSLAEADDTGDIRQSMLRRLVVLDDELLICDLVAAIAELSGFETVATQTVDEFSHVMTEGAAPDVVVLDLNLGMTDGVSVLRHLREIACESSILLLTGCEERVLQSAVAFGRTLGLTMLAPMRKPFDPAELQGALDQYALTHSAVTEPELKQALERGELVVHMQPVVEIATGRVVGAEALVRWRHPVRGLIHPDRFIPLVEESALILPLTLQVAQLAIGSISVLPGEPSVAINVPPTCLGDQHFPDQLVQIAFRHGMKPSRVTVEVTETAAMADPAFTTSQVTRLRIKGFHVALDDFGTGYSSLRELHRMPVSLIKVDRSFVGSILRDKAAQVIVKSIIGLANNLGLGVIAEGVENRETMEMLRSFDCKLAQGYHFARPMASDAFGGWLKIWEARGVELTVA
ncbi:MAG: EAL domain-containing response regulator [Proteobacteria bacterium]|nr:EAL domain-containing response regulator [Pseudomonadota bacterium]MBI3496336.1 EAL domain-containing response regulator [Pseudomonadota bacterium]